MARAVLFSILGLVMTFAAAMGASAQDIAGASDHPLVGRYAGSVINFYETRDYDEIALPERAIPAGEDRNPDAWTRDLAGEITSIRYEGPGDRSALEIMRNYEAALEGSGFEIVFFCRTDNCVEQGGISSFWDVGRGGIGLPTNWETSIYLLAERKDDQGRVNVGLLAVETAPRGDIPLLTHVAMTVVEAEAMDTGQIEFVEASAMEEAFATDGRIAIYGITFDFDSAALRPESLPQIEQLGTLLTDNPDLAVVIVGHTDSLGAFDYNLSLSQRRAQSVVDVLIADFGIDPARLTPAGAGMVSPVATNRTEEGRARNRRVEIVELYSQ